MKSDRKPLLQDLLAGNSSSGRKLVLTDVSGEILWVGSRDTLRQADRLKFSEGANWPEAEIGTEAISEALITAGLCSCSPPSTRSAPRHGRVSAAPIADFATGSLLGVLDVSGPLDTIGTDTLRLVRCAVRGRKRCWECPTAAPQ